MIDQREILWGIVAPPVLMTIGMVATAYLPEAKRILSTGALLALVFGVSLLGFRGWPTPGSNVHDWPAWIAFAGGLLTMCSLCGNGPLWWRLVSRVGLTGVASWLVLSLELRDAAAVTWVLWVGSATVLWSGLILASERLHGAVTPGISVTALAVQSVLSAVIMLLFDNMNHAQFAGILAAALGAAVVLNWWRPAWYAAAGPVTVAALVLPSLWLLDTFAVNTGLPVWALALLGLASLAPVLAAIAPVRTWSAWKRILLVNLAIVLIVSPALVRGVIMSIRASAEPSYGY